MFRRVQQAVETKTGKIRVVKEKTKKEENNRGKEDSRRVENLE